MLHAGEKEARRTGLGGRLRLGLGAAVLLFMLGCQNSRNDECRKFVSSVNGKLEEIERLTANRDPARTVTSAEMRQLAGLYEVLAQKTATGTLATPELAQLRRQYNLMVLEAAKHARAVADALDAKDIEGAMKAHGQFGEVVSKEDLLVGQVNAFCQVR